MNRFLHPFRITALFRTLSILSAVLFCLPGLSSVAEAGIVVTGDLTHEYQLKPGQTHEASIELENRDATPKTVRIYQTDYRYQANGQSFFPSPGTTERSNAGWLTFSPKVMTVPPMQKSRIRYLIRVPRDRTKKGTYWSMLMIQEVPDAAPAKTERKDNTVTLASPASRSGVQIVTQLENSGQIALEFTSATVVSKNAKRILSIDIENRGTRIAHPEMWLEVYTGGGLKAGRFVSEAGSILPGCSIRREIDISTLPKGTYNSLFIADCGQRDTFGLEIKLVLEGEPEPKPATGTRN
jgi:hypothetical protein